MARRRFEEVFPRLFPGGAAKMWQTAPGNLSETGIEIAPLHNKDRGIRIFLRD